MIFEHALCTHYDFEHALCTHYDFEHGLCTHYDFEHALCTHYDFEHGLCTHYDFEHALFLDGEAVLLRELHLVPARRPLQNLLRLPDSTLRYQPRDGLRHDPRTRDIYLQFLNPEQRRCQ